MKATSQLMPVLLTMAVLFAACEKEKTAPESEPEPEEKLEIVEEVF